MRESQGTEFPRNSQQNMDDGGQGNSELANQLTEMKASMVHEKRTNTQLSQQIISLTDKLAVIDTKLLEAQSD